MRAHEQKFKLKPIRLVDGLGAVKAFDDPRQVMAVDTHADQAGMLAVADEIAEQRLQVGQFGQLRLKQRTHVDALPDLAGGVERRGWQIAGQGCQRWRQSAHAVS